MKADLVDRIFEYLSGDPRMPAMTADALISVKRDIQREFSGEARKNMLAHAVLRLFDGANATTVARSLNISRATVYRYLKQARSERQAGAVSFKVPAKDRLTFAGSGDDTED